MHCTFRPTANFDETFRASYAFDAPSIVIGNVRKDGAPAAPETRSAKNEKSVIEEVMESRMAQNVARQAARTVTQQVIRGRFGMRKGR